MKIATGSGRSKIDSDKVVDLIEKYRVLTPLGKAFLGVEILERIEAEITPELKPIVSEWLFQ